MHGGLNNTDPQNRKGIYGKFGACLGITGQVEFAFNEEWYSRRKDLLARINRLERILSKEEGIELESSWKDSEALVKRLTQPQQTRTHKARTQH